MKKKLLIASLSILGVILLGAGIFSYAYLKGSKTPNHALEDYVVLEIKEGESIKAIEDRLAAKKVISNKFYFWLTYKLFNKTIRSGFYQFSPKISLADVVSQLESGSNQVIRVTIPEGWREEQIAQRLESNNIISYAAFMEEAKAYRGKLFPDTYFFSSGMEAKVVVLKMLQNYNNRTKDLDVSDDQLILASIIEREAANNDDRALIAGIYQNRLDLPMKLQSDPTVEYARDTINISQLSSLSDYTFWSPAKTVEFTSVKSAYNTYSIDGLPPSPICNPGLASIQAAINPEKSNYYYFLYGSDKEIHPAVNQQGHEDNIVNYLRRK